MSSDTFCACCGVPRSRYEQNGHHPECIYFEQELYKLAEQWLKEPPLFCDGEWQRRFHLIVPELLKGIAGLTEANKRINTACDLFEANSAEIAEIHQKLIKATGQFDSVVRLLDHVLANPDPKTSIQPVS